METAIQFEGGMMKRDLVVRKNRGSALALIAAEAAIAAILGGLLTAFIALAGYFRW